MTLKAIEIWNLNKFKGTYKHEKIKNQKQKKREDTRSNISFRGFHEMRISQ